MCGLAGFFGGRWTGGNDQASALLRQMSTCLNHRGPDDAGTWADEAGRIGLAHTRLAIVDLSSAGRQPMESASGRYVIAYNGEVYNHVALRAELAAQGALVAWRGHSDTETLLAGFEAWGLVATLKRAIGMFAFALWDQQGRELTLGRDRVGEKPLYYGWQGEGPAAAFVFGSELKPLLRHPEFKAVIDRDALALMMRHGYIPAPYSIYRSVSKLEPGCVATVSLERPEPRIESYWSGAAAAREGVVNPFEGDPEASVDALEALLMDAVGKQMMADVPLGAFLSGGIDSSTVVALMQAQSSRPVKTFSIGFHEAAYDEAQHAKAVAKHLGTDHAELYVTAEQAMDLIPRLSAIYDEPFADSSQIPTLLVSHLARRNVTVSLSGDGGDELFGGYERYRLTEQFWRRISRAPQPLRRAASAALRAVSPGAWNGLARFVPGAARVSRFGDKVHKGAGVLASADVADLYLGMVSSFKDPGSVVIGGVEPPTLLTQNRPALDGLGDIEQMMALDLLTYLPDDILTKVDRAAMSVSLESRVPMLDHRVIEFAWRLPLAYKLREGVSKWPLRQVLHRHVPREMIERPKMGFGVPIDTWLRGPLRDWAEKLLDETRLRKEGYFRPEPIRRLWERHQQGNENLHHLLWNVLMFQSWLEAQMDGAAPGREKLLASAAQS